MKTLVSVLFCIIGFASFAQDIPYSGKSALHYSPKPVMEKKAFNIQEYLDSEEYNSMVFRSNMPVLGVSESDQQMILKVESADKMPNLFFEEKGK